jgi:hypothetical protein
MTGWIPYFEIFLLEYFLLLTKKKCILETRLGMLLQVDPIAFTNLCLFKFTLEQVLKFICLL